MFVLIQAVEILGRAGQSPDRCEPTQQSDLADLAGEGWLLEAYGGQNISNNGKLAKDLRKLGKLGGKRTLLALRERAWSILADMREQDVREVKAHCPPAHGGSFGLTARVTLLGLCHGVAVVEASAIAEAP